MKNWTERVWRGDKGEVCETIDGRWQTTPSRFAKNMRVIGQSGKTCERSGRAGGDSMLSRQQAESYMEKPRETPVNTRGKYRVERSAPGITTSLLSTESAG